jgi:hypothetical protein
MQRRVDAKVTPEAMQTILLDEISGKLTDLWQKIDLQVPKGHVYSIPLALDTTSTKIVIMFSASIHNDIGSADVYILDSDRDVNTGDVPLKAGEMLDIALVERRATVYYVKTILGVATVRIFAME